ncbi:MAG: RecX family transcriptional regulator [Thermomicrobiales bacterium]
MTDKDNPVAPPHPGGMITRIAPQQRNPARVNIFLDGQFALALATQATEERGLRVGQLLTAATVAELRAADELGKAVDKALAFLTVRPRSIREVRDRLAKKDIPPSVIDAVIARLAGWGYIGDEGFARYWIENRGSNQPRGKRLLRQELWQKGVARETEDQALADTALDEDADALALARKRLPQLRALDEPSLRRRIGAYLLRRGYDWPTAKRALDALLTPGDEDESEPLGDSDSYV